MNPSIATKPISYIVHHCMADNNEVTTKNFQRYLLWALDSYRELNLFSLPCVKTVWLTIDDNFTIPLPDDYISYTAIGIRIGTHLFLLGRDEGMVLNRSQDCTTPLPTVNQNPNHFAGIYPYYYFFSGAFRGGQYVGEQYAHGGGWSSKGYYRIDCEKKQIQFSNIVPKTEIVLEYKSTGLDCDGSVEVPYEAISAITSFVHWQRILNDDLLRTKNPKAWMIAEQTRYRLWKSEFMKLKHLKAMDFTLQEYCDAKWRTSQQTARR